MLHKNNQAIRVNRSHSVGTLEAQRFYAKDRAQMGFLLKDQKPPCNKRAPVEKKGYLDPLIGVKIAGRKLVKWKLFCFFDKIIEFDKSWLLDLVSVGKTTGKTTNLSKLKSDAGKMQEKKVPVGINIARKAQLEL